MDNVLDPRTLIEIARKAARETNTYDRLFWVGLVLILAATLETAISPPTVAIDRKPAPSVYGFCPKCGAPGATRERRPNGDDICVNGHTYPSRDAVPHLAPPTATGDADLTSALDAAASHLIRTEQFELAQACHSAFLALRQRSEELAAERLNNVAMIGAIEELTIGDGCVLKYHTCDMEGNTHEVPYQRINGVFEAIRQRMIEIRPWARDAIESHYQKDGLLARVAELEQSLAATAQAEAAPSPRQIYDLCLAIEKIPASPEQTAAVVLASSLLAPGIRIDLGWDQDAIRTHQARG